MGFRNAKQSWKTRLYNSSNAPSEIFNKRLYICVAVFGILGAVRGLDEGSISGSIAAVRFQERFGLSDPNKSESAIADLKSNIASMVQLGSIPGALFAFYVVDYLGRLRSLQAMCIFWIASTVIQITAHNVGQLYAGRFLEGFPVGLSVVLGPTMMSEIAPKDIRGLCNCMFAGAVYFGVMIEYFTHYACAVHVSDESDNQWIIPTCLKIMFGGIILIGSFFCIESPRWYMKNGKIEKAYECMSKLRNLPREHAYVMTEIADIQDQLDLYQKSVGDSTMWNLFKELFSKTVIYRLYIGLGVQILGQWSGSSSVTIYMPELVALVGYRGDRKLLMTAVLGIVKLTSAYVTAFFLIDFLGRKKCLYMGITIQMFSMLYFAIFVAIVPEVADEDYVMTSSESKAGVCGLVMLYFSGIGWTMGFNSIQYLINSEMFPLRVRSFGTAFIMCFHFLNQFANTKAVPSMMISMKVSGTFFFFFAILAVSLVWCWFSVPEIAGRSLEGMEELFSLPWYQIGRKGAELCPDNSGVTRVRFDENGLIDREAMIEYKRDEEFLETATQASSAGQLTRKDTSNTSINEELSSVEHTIIESEKKA
uniref:MFS transporter n=1 Tax=Cyberlindnera americana TaxID=36016 RepID=A0A5P8N8T3_9ASCO|nr:MFS transporter [Cyberlindnera americana]